MKPRIITLLEEELKISLYRIAELEPTSRSKSYYVDKENNLIELSLNNLNLNSIPNAFYEGISDLKSVRTLSLRSNNIIKLGTFLYKMKELSILDLRNNEIEDVTIFKNLEAKFNSIFLDDNAILDITPFFEKLHSRQVKELYFTNNPIVFPGDINDSNDLLLFEERNRNLVEAIIKENIAAKKDHLDLGKLGITDLSPFKDLMNCMHLKTLIISNEWAEFNVTENRWDLKESKNKGPRNNLYSIPKEISKLKNLETLIIGGDWKSKLEATDNNWRLTDISGIFKLQNLSYLNASNNRIVDISHLKDLQNLEIAHLNNNSILKVPRLDKLLKLREIFLSNNLIQDVNFLKAGIQLETVDLHSNKISNLLPLEDLLKRSKNGISVKKSSWEKGVISISNNSPKIVPPYEIFEQGNAGFFLYLELLKYEEALKLDKYFNKEIKIILVGNSSSGKSTMLHYLKTKRYKKNIPITHWLATEELKDIKIEGDVFKLRFFDFGGQDYYHDTHKMFFTSDSVYLLLWDSESNRLGQIKEERGKENALVQVFPLEYWLESIKIFAKKSLSESQQQMERLLEQREKKIINEIRIGQKTYRSNDPIAVEKQISNNSKDKNILVIQNKIDDGKEYLDQKRLEKNYLQIYDFANISLLKKQGAANFEELYFDVIKNNQNYKKPLLATWGYIKDNLHDVFKSDSFIIDIKSFKERINDYLLHWLKTALNKNDNEISKILFDDDDIVLFANFLREIGLVIYDSENDELKGTVIVNQNDFLKQVYFILNVAKNNYGKLNEVNLIKIPHRDLVLKTLANHKIIFKEKQEASYIAPLFLPEKPNALIDLLADIKIPFRRFRFKGFIPKSIILSVFSEVIVKEDISEEDFYYWKNGLIFKDKQTQEKLLIQFNMGYNYGYAYIDIFNLNGQNKASYVKRVSKIIGNVILGEEVKADELLTIDGKYFVEMEKLIFRYNNNVNYITATNIADKKTKQVSVFNFSKFLDEKMKKPNKKLFISYSKQDEKIVNNFIEHLASLQSMGIIESWYCTELKTGDDWDAKIKEKLNEADIVCLMISPKFMSTPYIHKYEVKHTFKRFEAGEDVKIVPIILDFVDWSRGYSFTAKGGEEIIWTLNRFNALPFTGKQVKDFKNENKAWYSIIYAIKVIIEDNLISGTYSFDQDDIVRKFPPDIRKIYEEIVDGTA